MQQQTFEVHLNVRQRSGYLSAVCPEVPGLHVIGQDPEQVRQSAMRAVTELSKRNAGISVRVSPTDNLNVLRVRVL